MSNGLFWGCFLIAAGPPFVLYCAVIAQRSFLVLLSLASAFYWLLVFLLISAVFRGLLPLDSTAAFVLVVLLSATLQEIARYGLWQLHRKNVVALELIARRSSQTQLTCQDKQAMSLTHGFAHGICQSILLCISWLPLSFGGVTYYTAACPAISYFLATALLALGFFLLHTASMVIAFEGWGNGSNTLKAIPPALHLAVSLLTVANMAHKGCSAVVPLVCTAGLGTTGYAVQLWWRSLRPGYDALEPSQSL